VSKYFGKKAGGVAINDAVSFAAALLEQSHVAVVPGNDSGFDTHVRLSFATSMEQIDKGIDRIAEFLKKIG
jgi:aspartate aminotransferase